MISETFTISSTVTFIKNEQKVYNWINGEYIEFNNDKHPFLNIIINQTKRFSKFQYEESYDDFEWLLEKKFIVENIDVIKEIIKNDIVKRNALNELTLILLPADNACNLDCVYCYEDHSLKKYMGNEENKRLLQFIKNKNVDKVTIEWFGGEPMLNKNFILKLCSDIKNIANIEFISSMTTNAYLLDIDTFKNFIDVNLNSFQITLDGLEDDHNKLRPLSNSKEGSYKLILDNLINISLLPNSFKFKIMIRVNFNNNSATKSKRTEVLAKFYKLFGDDERFSYIFRPIGDYASSNNKKVENEVLCLHDSQHSIQKLYEEESILLGLNIAELGMYFGNGSAVCYAGKRNHFVIDSNMKVKKCTVALDDPINMVGSIENNGNFIENKNYILWIQDDLYRNINCSSCFFISQCQSNNCKLKTIKNFMPTCPSEIIVNEEQISNQLIEYIQKYEENR